MDDAYDYLEAQLESGKPDSKASLPPPPPVPKEETSGHKSSRRDDERKSSRRSRSRSRDRGDRDRKKGRSRSPRKDRGDRDRKERQSSRDRERNRPEPPPFVPKPRQDRDDFRGGGGGREPPRRYEQQQHVREWDRPSTPPELKLQREKEQELKDLERTVRTIMVMNLNLKAEEEQVFGFFSSVGAINDIKLIRDKNTRRSKGIAYIEYSSVESAINALTLNGQIFMGMGVMVKPSEAEKNLAWEAQQQAKLNQSSALTLLNKMGGSTPGVQLNPIKVQILNLHPDIGDEDLKELFLPFGEINYVRVVRDAANRSTGEAYVQYANERMATASINHFNGFEIAGRKLAVQVAPVYNPNGTVQPMVEQMQAAAHAMAMGLMPGMPGMLPPPPIVGMEGMQSAGAQGGGEVDDLDEGENKSFKLNAQSRAALMNRLASSAGMQAPPSFLVQSNAPQQLPPAPLPYAPPPVHVSQQVLMDQGLLGPASPIPTACLLLKNMFTEADKMEPNWQAEMEEDVKGEAAKFGEVVHCHVEPASTGHVYLKFSTQQAAEAATRTFHGRYYSGNQIVVSYQFVQPYNSRFGLAR